MAACWRRAWRERALPGPPRSSRAKEAFSAPSRIRDRWIERHDARPRRGLARARHGDQALSLLPLRAWRRSTWPSRRRQRHRGRMTSISRDPHLPHERALLSSRSRRMRSTRNSTFPMRSPWRLLYGHVRLADFTETAIRLPPCWRSAAGSMSSRMQDSRAKYPAGVLRRAEGAVAATAAQRRFSASCPSGDPEAQQYQLRTRRDCAARSEQKARSAACRMRLRGPSGAAALRRFAPCTARQI